MFAFPLEPVFWNWLILGIALLIAEALISGFFIIWLGVSALAVSVITLVLPDLSLEMQLLLFSILSVASVSAWLLYRKKNPSQEVDTGLNQRGSENIGRTVVLTAPITNSRGKEVLDGIPWGLTGPDAAAGDTVKIVGIDGNRFVVEKIES